MRCPWYEDRAALVEFLHWLRAEGFITTADDAIYVVEKPAKWANEHHAMLLEQDEETTR